ncbi:hypothetical protein L211DRAFT_834957 [Terfezia boudieri ATCC MYA-4762]|uniref:Uncharacterized protein n=1 Tax=Terfezia boudieri ATCC MYA-4762 TaxID=1051890 RepID=A0A3N4M008_9PEZI|nr:hypothetical protein L211DRAFT_834957 [Terfezia boudieri ATCC MYA-4762]
MDDDLGLDYIVKHFDIYTTSTIPHPQQFWECLCIARDQALTKSNILSGFEASGIWPFCPEKVIDRHENQNEITSKKAIFTPSTPFKIDFQYHVIEPNSLGVKEFRSSKQVKTHFKKHIQGPRKLDRAYIEQEKACIAAATTLVAEKAANREVRKLAKEQNAKEAKEHAEELRKAK